MKKHRRLGRPGAGALDRRGAHARRLLLVLIGITRRLARLQSDREARAAYRTVERELAKLGRTMPGPSARKRR